MKTTIKTIIIAAATVFAAISCQKEVEVTGTQGQVKEGESIELDIKAGLGDLVSIDAKATATSVVRLTWEEGDVVDAYCGTTKLNEEAPITVTPSANKMFASLTGTITAPAEGNTITFVYSKGCAAEDLAFDFSSQTADNIPFVAYGTLEYEGTTITNKMVEFKFATSIMKIATTNLASGETIKDVTISGINTKVTLTPSQSGEPAIDGSTPDSISTENFIQSSDGTKAVITAGLVPDTNTGRELVVTQNEVRAVALTSATINKNTSYFVPSTFAGAIAYVIIDGLKWATMNLGASSVTDYGTYYSWGDVKGQKPAGSDFSKSFSWDNDVFGKTFNKVAQNTACPNGILASTYDAAYKANSAWRMPTSAEFTALADACGGPYSFNTTKNPGKDTSVGKGIYWCTNYDGVAGCLFCDGTNKLFFPAAGCGESTFFSGAGSRGNYWSSSLGTYTTEHAYYLYFFSKGVDSGVYPLHDYNRCCGFSVRPVSD